ncbi:MAG: hypothetical protein PUJ86_11795 [Mycobacteriaceae bacterium]|nr:hypothetical protein [Mycobacteriaceae bacterium]
MPGTQRMIAPGPPTGWPVGSFKTYAEAQAAVDMLSDKDFPVQEITIVGVDLMQVENVHGKLTWGKVIGAGAASGAWMGLFFGLLMGIFSATFLAPLLSGLVIGAIFGVIFAAIAYGTSSGKRDFTSTTSIVATRYDVLCSERDAPRARDLIAETYSKIRPRTTAGKLPESNEPSGIEERPAEGVAGGEGLAASDGVENTPAEPRVEGDAPRTAPMNDASNNTATGDVNDSGSSRLS